MMGGARRVICLVWVALTAVACSSSSSPAVTPNASASIPAAQRILLVFAKWAPSADVRDGVEPGYEPALTGLTGHDVTRASSTISGAGVGWVVDVSFNAHGRALLAQLTHDNLRACLNPNQDCPERHLAVWLGLSQADIDSWAAAGYADRVSQPYDIGCLTQQAAKAACPKLVSNPAVLAEITGGSMEIGGNFTQQSANELADSINSAAHA